jgi:hypothetical protein
MRAIAIAALLGLGLSAGLDAMTNFHPLFSAPSVRSDRDEQFDEWVDDFDSGWDRSSPLFRYNRVEGLFMGYELKPNWRSLRHPERAFLFGSAGYAFAAKEFEYQIGLEKGFFESNRLAFSAEAHRLVDTPDRWIMPDIENSLAAFFFKEDFQDFYFREGWSATVGQTYGGLTVSASYCFDKLDSLSKTANWSLFGGHKRFRENPAMTSGELKSWVGRIVFDTRDAKKDPGSGWFVEIEGEHGFDEMSFDRILIDGRRYQPLGFGEGLNLRIRLGSVSGDMPWQRSFQLGGPSTLRGFAYKSFPAGPMQIGGNRMMLAQAEYKLGEGVLDSEGFLGGLSMALFADAGWVGIAETGRDFWEGFDGLTLKSIRSDVGAAIMHSGGHLRVEVARRTDTSKKPYQLWLRINQPF